MLKDTALKENVALALKTPKPNVSPHPYHLPLASAAGVRLPKTHHIPQLYLHSHLVTEPYLLPYFRLIECPSQFPQEGTGGIIQQPSSKDKALIFPSFSFKLGGDL